MEEEAKEPIDVDRSIVRKFSTIVKRDTTRVHVNKRFPFLCPSLGTTPPVPPDNERQENTMKIVVLDGYAGNPGDLSWDRLAALGELTVYERTPAEQVLQRMGGALAVYTNKAMLSREILTDAYEQGLRFVGVLATGYNVVDVPAAKELGIAVTNIPNYGTQAVAQHTIALLLELCNRVGLHDQSVRDGEWARCEDFCFTRAPLTELSGKTIGLVGFGHIGQAVAKIASALGMNVLAYTPSAKLCGGAQYADLDTLLRHSDVISLHCPLTDANAKMLDAAAFAKMKRGAFLLNTARGGLVDELALRDALRQGSIAGAALDVVSSEPMPQASPLREVPNLIITPHIAWAAKEARMRLMDIAVDNLRQFLAGSPQNLV